MKLYHALIKYFYDTSPYIYGLDKILALLEWGLVDCDELKKHPAWKGQRVDGWEWQDFLDEDLWDPYEELIQRLVGLIDTHYPSAQNDEWCSEQGMAALKNMRLAIEESRLPFPPTHEELASLGQGQYPARYAAIISATP